VETLARLTRACGFELDVRLRESAPDKVTPDPVVRQDIEYELARTPEQRIDDLRIADELVKVARRVG
jgi:hypothetical protein